MICRTLITMALFTLFAAPAAWGQQRLEKGQQEAVQGKGTEAGALAEADTSGLDKQEIIQEIIGEKYRMALLAYRLEKSRKYIANAKQNIEDLEYKKAEFRNLQDQLQQYLNQVILRFEEFIARDLPFLPDEREKRIAGLKKNMDNYDLPLSEKLRQVFEEGLQIEADYGRTVEAASNETLSIDGVDTPVIILRLGRMAMYYMTLDEAQTGFYNPDTGRWEPLPNSMNRNIKLLVEIGQRTRTAQIVTLPLGNAGD